MVNMAEYVVLSMLFMIILYMVYALSMVMVAIILMYECNYCVK